MSGTNSYLGGGDAEAAVTTSLVPQVGQVGGHVSAQADTEANLADILLLSDGTRMESGQVTWTGHGLAVRNYYWLDQSAPGGYTNVKPTTGLIQRLFYVEDADTIHIDVEHGVTDCTASPAAASHTTVLATCPATGPTVAPTAEGHYFYRSTLGELWQWVYGDAAPAVIGSYASGAAVTAGWPFTFSTAVPMATVVLIAAVTLPRSGKIIASGGGITLCNTNTPTSIASWCTLNGAQISRDSTTIKPPSLVSPYSNDAGMAVCVNVVAGDVLAYNTYITDTSGVASGRIDYVYTS